MIGPLDEIPKGDPPTKVGGESPPIQKNTWRRRIKWIALSILIGLLLAILLAPVILKAVIRRELRATVAESLIGDLRIGSISFSLPWTVTFTDTSFTAKGAAGESVEMFRLPRLTLQFSKSPLASGPAAIATASIDNPVVHLIQTAQGIVGVRTDRPPSKQNKFSDMARIGHVALQGGQFILEDRTASSVPTAWRKVGITLDLGNKSPADYAYHVSAQGAADTVLDSSGRADLDALVLDVESCAANVLAGRAAGESGLPAVAQEALRHVGAVGDVAIHASGKVPLTHPQTIAYQADIQIKNGGLNIQEWQTHFDTLATQFSIDATAGWLRPKVQFSVLDTSSGDASLHIEDAPVSLDLTNVSWSGHLSKVVVGTGSSRQSFGQGIRDALASWNLKGTVEFALDGAGPLNSGDLSRYRAELNLKPADLSLQPPTMQSPLDRFADTTIALEGGNIRLHQMRAMCGDDILFVRDAVVGLAKLPAQFSVEQAGGAITFGAKHGSYPPQVSQYIDRYDPVGPFFFAGNLSTDSTSDVAKVNYDFEVRSQRGRFSLIDHRIPMYNVVGLVHITPQMVEIRNLDADAIGGRLAGNGRVDLGKQPEYHLQLNGTNLDLRELAQRMATPGHPAAPVSGRARLNIECAGGIPENGSVLDQLKGSGNFDIRQGAFFEIPVFSEIAKAVNVRQAAIVSDAAAQFHVGNQKIQFDRALLSSPALGVEGTGTVDFTGNMDFHKVTALVGGDWRRNTGENTGIGQVVGKIQGALNEATRVVWSEVDITGAVEHPVVKSTPAPFIVKPVLHFKEMLGK